MKRTFVCMATLLFVAVFSAQAAVLWNGERTYSNGRALPTANDRIVIAAEKFAGIKVGDRLMFEFGNYAADPLTNQHIIRLSTPVTYASLNHNINVSEGDKKASVTIDETLRDKLMASGLVIGGTGFTMTSISVHAVGRTQSDQQHRMDCRHRRGRGVCRDKGRGCPRHHGRKNSR